MFCSKCGNQVNENDKFCSSCGNKEEVYNKQIKIFRSIIKIFSFVLLLSYSESPNNNTIVLYNLINISICLIVSVSSIFDFCLCKKHMFRGSYLIIGMHTCVLIDVLLDWLPFLSRRSLNDGLYVLFTTEPVGKFVILITSIIVVILQLIICHHYKGDNYKGNYKRLIRIFRMLVVIMAISALSGFPSSPFITNFPIDLHASQADLSYAAILVLSLSDLIICRKKNVNGGFVTFILQLIILFVWLNVYNHYDFSSLNKLNDYFVHHMYQGGIVSCSISILCQLTNISLSCIKHYRRKNIDNTLCCQEMEKS